MCLPSDLDLKSLVLKRNYYLETTIITEAFLGTQLFNVPLIIGVNWFILTIGTRACSNWFTESILLQIVFAAIIMVGLDLLIEPIAIKYEFWNWGQNEVPKQNYFMWLIASIIMQAIITKKAH